MFEIIVSAERVTSDSRPSPSDRVHSSLPPAAPPRPLPPRAAAGGGFAPWSSARTNATRDPSGDGAMLISGCGVVHTAAAAPPSIGTRQRSPSLGTISVRPSLLQNAPASDEP